MLKALIRWLWPPEAPRRTKDAADDYITRAEFEREIERITKDAEWLFNEWHEKFSALHARLTKRAQRSHSSGDGPAPSQNGQDVPEPGAARPSVLAYRKPWSV